MLRVQKLKLEMVEHQRQCEHSHKLSQRLAQANTLASEEWTERERVPLFAIGSQIHRALWVKTVRFVFFWVSPLIWVFVDRVKV